MPRCLAFSSIPSSAARWCSTASCTPACTATPARWGRCRSAWARRSGNCSPPHRWSGWKRATLRPGWKRGPPPTSARWCLPWEAPTRTWLADAAPALALALAVNGAACLLDLDGVIVDGSCSCGLLAGMEGAFDAFDWEGVARPLLLAGTIGPDARALGGALIPLYANFAPDRDLFLKRLA